MERLDDQGTAAPASKTAPSTSADGATRALWRESIDEREADIDLHALLAGIHARHVEVREDHRDDMEHVELGEAGA